ncbi:hypothetical protein HE1_01154 [Holospora elegans E1]|uniref:Uncharacterized protein n=1 Tax=Holospora elegans E1 TaxID=1427503 RepID=A0A023E143_9PROT|nr:hypothetical protein HE1_01154 [Holospora elegans E1]
MQPIKSEEVKKVMRNIAYTSFYYDSNTKSKPGPRIIENNKLVDLDKKLREDENAKNKLLEFENVVSELTGLEAGGNNQEAERWRFLRSVIALDNAVYPEDTELSLPNIDRELKNAIAWRCLLICGDQYVNKNNIHLAYMNEQQINDFFLVHAEQNPVVIPAQIEHDEEQFIQ